MARILVVEDDAEQLEIRKQILEHAGYEVVTAATASQALERMAGCEIVLMDLQIPTHEEGLRLIHAAAGSARIIVLSGAAPDADVPVDEFLMKPCSSRKLLEVIAKFTS
jgi:CheY-like chemotaxis protein